MSQNHLSQIRLCAPTSIRVWLTNAPMMKKSSKYSPFPLSFLEINRKPTESVDKINAKQVAVITTCLRLSRG